MPRWLLITIAAVGGSFALAGWCWWLADGVRWVRRLRARRRAGPLGTGMPPPDPAPASRYVPRSGGER